MARSTVERGDTPHTDDKAALVDTTTEPNPKRRGDTPRTEAEPALVDKGDYDPNGPSPNEFAAQQASKAKKE